MPNKPASPSSGHRSRGNSLLRSISSARGRDALAREPAHLVADLVEFFAEAEVEITAVENTHEEP